jgi:hypothetical protein
MQNSFLYATIAFVNNITKLVGNNNNNNHGILTIVCIEVRR